MPRSVRIEPDLNFIRELKALGAGDMKKCFQCASCSVVCGLSPERYPFPRKEMLWAQWGMKERLLSDPDIWLCHQCNDCSQHCPRSARPGDMLAVLRQMVIRKNSFPRALGGMVDRPRFLPLLFSVSALFLAFAIYLAGGLRIPEGPVLYKKFIPYAAIDTIFLLTAFWAFLSSFFSIHKTWQGFKVAHQARPAPRPIGETTSFLFPVVVEILSHIRFRDCVSERGRYLAHLNIFWGFVLLTITTAGVAAGIYFFGKATPLPMTHPIKWLGNVGGIILLLGCSLALGRRLSAKAVGARGTSFDWIFLLLVLGTAISGFLAEIFRAAALPYPAYSIYFLHLLLVWFLLASFPYSKFAHFLYRTAAIIYTRSTAYSSYGVSLPGTQKEGRDPDAPLA